jgi:hypothetical protein
MMTEQLGFSVISAPLAAIDRRALSQAWYSSLHIERARTAAAPSRPVLKEPSIGAHLTKPERAPSPAKDVRVTNQWQSKDRSRSGGPLDIERRTARSPIAREIERGLLDPKRPLQRTTLLLRSERTRLFVTLQPEKGGARLIAVCSTPNRAVVERALEQARFALAARGIRLLATVKER